MCMFLKTTSSIKCVNSNTMNPRWTPTQMISSFGVPVVIEKDPVLQWQPGWCSQYCGLLLTWWSWDQIPVGGENFHTSRTTPMPTQPLVQGVPVLYPKSAWSVVLVPGCAWVGAIPPSPLCACTGMSWCDLCHYQYCNIVCVFFFFEVCIMRCAIYQWRIYIPIYPVILLCSYCAYWIINVYYIPTYAQISSINLS